MSTPSLASIGTGPVSIALFSSLAAGLGLRTTWLLCGVLALVAPVAVLTALRHPESVEDRSTGSDAEQPRADRAEDAPDDDRRPVSPQRATAAA
ncbi:hypothetical protein QQY24_27920 [Streptomyces sp. TG1A-8]|uniref:hypothetical protein n=1 Tax=Streptomyces sp. TG1A-8 TaxID=3051385 RepID=UPI00265BCB02|nr:hypothetical protein [Streptomyces sp. TG1A-8]MDO0929050.1 hypothetical protein [Streptomyces sp. TG1A-8]